MRRFEVRMMLHTPDGRTTVEAADVREAVENYASEHGFREAVYVSVREVGARDWVLWRAWPVTTYRARPA